MKTLTFVLAAGVLAGCYQYTPVESAVVPERGSEVRARLSPMQDIDLGQVTVRDVQMVDGVVFRATEDTLAVSSTWLRPLIGGRYGTNGDVFYFERDRLAAVEVRTLHPAKTVVALAGTALVSTGIFTFIADAGAGAGDDGDKGDVSTRIVFPIP